jgi:tRNA nucleotidyltransferase (CCA-adding enzyme)
VSQPPQCPPAAERAIARLRAAGIEVHLVGGAVRDTLLGRPLRDVDLLVEAELADAARVLPEATEIRARAPVLALPHAPGEPRVEISAPRAESRDLIGDLHLRDFTVNGIAFDLARNVYVDPTGGRDDLRAGVLRSAQPRRALRDDPLRILRAARLEQDLELMAEPETERALMLASPRLGAAAGERLREELFRLLAGDQPSRALTRLRRWGALAAVLPELLRGVGVAQNRHHPDDVYRHSLRVADGVAAVPLLRLAALLHDVAKPETKAFKPAPANEERAGRARRGQGDFTFLRHDREASGHLERIAARLRLSRRDAALVRRLVRHHLLFPNQLESPAAVRRMVRRVGRDILDDLLALRRADLASRQGDLCPPEEWVATERRIREVQGQASTRAAERLAIGGDEVMELLGLEAGPEIGGWLRRLEDRILEHPEENRRDRLRAWLLAARRSGEV